MKTVIKNILTLLLFINAGSKMDVHAGLKMPAAVRLIGFALAVTPFYLHQATGSTRPQLKEVGRYNISNPIIGFCPALPSEHISKKP